MDIINTCHATTETYRSVAVYSHLVPTIVSVFLALYILFKTKFSFQARVFTVFVTFFSFWLIGDLILWLSTDYNLVVFFWSQLDLTNMIFFSLAAYFFATIISGKDISIGQKLFLFVITLPGFYVTATGGTVESFDQAYCNVNNSYLLTYYKLFQEFVCVLYIVGVGFLALRKKNEQETKRSQIILNMVSFSFFLIVFAITEFLASNAAGLAYTISLYGLFVLPIFLLLIIISIVRLHMFEMQSIATQLLVYVLIIMVGTQFFFLENSTNKILNAFTLVLAVCFGYLLIRNINREKKNKERIEALADDLKKSNTRLLELDKQKSEFVSYATHQLRAPLTAMKGYTSMLLDGDLGVFPDAARDAITRIFESSKTLANVVDDYLNVSRIELGTMKYVPEPLDMKEMLKSVIAELKPSIAKSPVKFAVSFDPENALHFMVNADRDKLKQVLMNLIDNAFKYTPEGSIDVMLSRDEKTNKVTFSIKDTGIGIDPAVMPKLFSKFARANNANSTNIRGTGLGLFVAKDVVLAHKGRIWAESPGEGKGSTFYVELAGV